jgi:hypothetical protein
MSGNEPIEFRNGGPTDWIAGMFIAAAGAAGLYLIASGKFGLFPDFWKRTIGAVVLGLLAVLLAGLVLVGLRLLLWQVVRIDFERRRITSSVGLPFIWLRTAVYPASEFDSIVLSSGTRRGPFVSSFACSFPSTVQNGACSLRSESIVTTFSGGSTADGRRAWFATGRTSPPDGLGVHISPVRVDNPWRNEN